MRVLPFVLIAALLSAVGVAMAVVTAAPTTAPPANADTESCATATRSVMAESGFPGFGFAHGWDGEVHDLSGDIIHPFTRG
ncbi:MAG: hypothetical protein ACKOWF_00780 [Chloroflexota bacterium]